eukprot:5584880-Ditylum_brightwellii.AAC.1
MSGRLLSRTYKCADGDICQFETPRVKPKHMYTHSCGGYLCGAFCGVQEWKKKYINKTAYNTLICQKFAAVLVKTELVYKPPIHIDKKESESSNNNRQNETNLQKRRSSSRISKNNDGRSKDTAAAPSAVLT